MKRAFDLVASATLLLVLAPVLLVVALLILFFEGAPVLFRQERPGLYGRPFRLYKFRTMRAGDGPDEERLTGLGRALRRASLDELPQLVNVLRGEMSLVGPRPLLTEYLPLYSARQARRHEVRPGITGWAQVNGRNTTDWPERFEFDVWYVEHRSFALDLRILVLTLTRVLSGSGVSQAGRATMEKFRGNDG
jgi:lipopolysaccharide/colanic/teichoic acid biosynthesis glycosyltransferase